MKVYHYTNIEALHSILSSNIVRLTDFRFLNDKSEVTEGLKLVLLRLDLFIGKDVFIEERGLSDLNLVKEFVANARDYETALPLNFYILSFTSSINKISHWRGYGMYAIEFDEKLLKPELYLQKCNYNKNDVAEEIDDLLLDLVADLGKYETNCTDDFRASTLEIIFALFATATSLKHSGFGDEQEVRAISLFRIGGDFVKFQPKENHLVPYIEVTISPKAINRVFIGPLQNQALSQISLNSFLEQINTERGISKSGDPITLEVSNLPFREV